MYSKTFLSLTMATAVVAHEKLEQRATRIGDSIPLDNVPSSCVSPIRAVFSSLPTQPANFDLDDILDILQVKSCSVSVGATMTAPAISYASELLEWYSTNATPLISIYDKCTALSVYSDFPNCVSNFISVNKHAAATATATATTSSSAKTTEADSSAAAETGDSAASETASATDSGSATASSTESAASTSASEGAATKNTGMGIAAVAAAGVIAIGAL